MGVCLSRCGGSTHNWESRHSSVEAKKRKISAPSPYDPNHSFKMFLQAQQSKNSPSTTWSLPRSSELFSLPASELHEHRQSPNCDDATSSYSRASTSKKLKRIQPEQPAGHQRLLEAIARLERLDDKQPGGGSCALGGMSSLCSSDDVNIAVKPRSRNRRVRHYQLPLPKENPVQDFLRSIEGFVSLIDEPRKPPEPSIVGRREPKIVSRVDDGAVGEETFAFEFGRLRQDQNQVPISPVQRLLQYPEPQKNDLKLTGAAMTEDCQRPRNRSGGVDGAVVGEEMLFALEFEAFAGLRQDRNLQELQGLPQSGPRKTDMKCPDAAGTGDCVEPGEDAGVGEETFTLDLKALKHQKLDQAAPPTRKSMSLQQLLQSAHLAQNNDFKSPPAQDRIKGPSCRAPEAHVKIGQDDIVASLRSRNVVARKNYKSKRSLTRGGGGLKQERSLRSLESLQSFDIHVNWEFDNKGDDFATPTSPSSVTPPTSKHLDEALPSIEVKKVESELLQVSPSWSSNTSTAVVENRSPKDAEAPLVEDVLDCTELGPAAAIVSSKSSDSKQIVQFISERFGLLEAFQSLLKILLFSTEEDPDEENQYGVHPRE